jgi:hypothetical protein
VQERGTECEAIPASSAQLGSLEDTTYSGTHSAIDGNDDTHDSVAKDTGADCHFPAEANSDDGRSCATNVSKRLLPLTQQTNHIAGDSPTSQFETAQASAIQYATYALQFQVRFDGGIGSKSALEAFLVAAKLLSS